MRNIKNREKKSFDYLSRYSSFSFNYHIKDKKYFYELTSQLDDSTTQVLVTVNDATTLDSLALKYYGRPDYWWIIADFNRIRDPFLKLSDTFTKIKIPSISVINYLGE